MTAILPAEGSLAAHEALRAAMTDWQLTEVGFDHSPTPTNALRADDAWFTLIAHARNCGMSLTVPSVRKWVFRRLGSFAALTGQPALDIGWAA